MAGSGHRLKTADTDDALTALISGEVQMRRRVSLGIGLVGVLMATASCKADRSSSGSVASQRTPMPLGALDTTLVWNDISFHVIGRDSSFIIQPSGLDGGTDPVNATTSGLLMNAAIADLDKDGKPELLVFSASPDSARRVSLMAYAANDKGLTRLDFDGVNEDPRATPGYAGHDAFTVTNGMLVQTFPLYDGRGQPTGKARRLQYVLVNGEGTRLLRIDSVADY
jgi:hypothetical protein